MTLGPGVACLQIGAQHLLHPGCHHSVKIAGPIADEVAALGNPAVPHQGSQDPWPAGGLVKPHRHPDRLARIGQPVAERAGHLQELPRLLGPGP